MPEPANSRDDDESKTRPIPPVVLDSKPADAPAVAPAADAKAAWFLETILDRGQRRRIPLHPLPFRVGRQPGVELQLPSRSVSKHHAEIYEADGALKLRDSGSTNGTFLNHRRVRDANLSEGSIVHFSDFEFRLGKESLELNSVDLEDTLALGKFNLPRGFAQGTKEMKELLLKRLIEPVFQPIVTLPGGGVAAYEALARGRHPQLPEAPDELFRIAESIGVETELSRLCRKLAVLELAQLKTPPALFLNTHPSELKQPGLVESLAELRVAAPQIRLVLEIHESVLADPSSIAQLRTRLTKLGIGLAYDDFGAGQARLLELSEVPPDFLKFDLRFVRGIDTAPASKRRVLSSFLSAAADLLVRTVAEGVETPGEAKVCANLGFTHAQGFHYERLLPGTEV